MADFKKFLPQLGKTVFDFYLNNQETILTTLSCTSSAVAIAVVYRNSPKIHDILDGTRSRLKDFSPEESDKRKEVIEQTLKDLVPLVGPVVALYLISAVSAIASDRSSKKKIAALTAAYAVAEKTIKEYDQFKIEAKKELGEEKVANIVADGYSEEVSKKLKNSEYDVLPGDQLWFDPVSGHLFSSNLDRIKLAVSRAQNEADNWDCCGYDYILREMGVKAETQLDFIGWSSGEQIDYYVGSGRTEECIPYNIIEFTPHPHQITEC